MSINLSKFSQEIEAVVPILQGKFIYRRKMYDTLDSDLDGWYKVKIKNNSATPLEESYFLDSSNLSTIKGYTCNNVIVFQNFDVAKRKYNLQVSSTLNLNKADSFSSINAVVWEDGKVYYDSLNYSDNYIYDIKSCFDSDQDIRNLKGVTPELKTLFLLHSIEREQLRELEKIRLEDLAKEEREAREKELMSTLQGRLKVTFSRAGATLLNYSLSNNRVIVDWVLDSSGQEFNSVLDSRTLAVIEAGYCMSNEDNKHNATSMVKLAEDYEERDLIYITRR